ncbi:MAG: dihydrofolate reductase [Rickettsiaceae bacterium]|nr:dihydrofolate reductase [Rickettsiaceae bacterium]
MLKNNKITGIMACTKSGVIGLNNKVPWNYPDEFKHFKQTTYQHIVIMGRKTFAESLTNNIAKNRFNIVFSKNSNLKKETKEMSNTLVVANLEEFFAINNLPENKKIFMIGGAEIANLFLENNLLSDFILTKIHREYPGDTFLPMKYFQKDGKLLTKTADFSIYYYKI